MKQNNLFDDNSIYEIEDNFILEMEDFLSEFDSEWQEPYAISGDIADAYNNTMF